MNFKQVLAYVGASGTGGGVGYMGVTKTSETGNIAWLVVGLGLAVVAGLLGGYLAVKFEEE